TTFWLTSKVLDYCQSPSDEPGVTARAPQLVSGSFNGSRSQTPRFLPSCERLSAGGWLAPGASLFRAEQPRKLCVQDGDGFGGGFPGHQAERDGGEGREHAGTPGPLVAGVGSAAARSQAACLFSGLVEADARRVGHSGLRTHIHA